MKKNIKILATNFYLELGQVDKNLEKIKNIVKNAEKEGVNIISLPELSLTGASLYDFYKEDLLIKKVEEAILDLLDFSKSYDLLISLGAPLRSEGKLYNTVIFIKSREILTSFVKEELKDYEKMIFSTETPNYFTLGSFDFPADIISPVEVGGLKIGVAIGEDEKTCSPSSLFFKEKGADIILNPNAYEKQVLSIDKTIGDIKFLSKNTVYVSTGSGLGESSTDTVFQGLNLIADDGEIVAYKKNEGVYYTKAFEIDENSPSPFNNFTNDNIIVDKFPYLPKKEDEDIFVRDVLEIASSALFTRMRKIGVEDTFIGVSGGLDSTMALLFLDYAYEKAGISKEKIHAYTMPAFATSKRTKSNANLLCEALGIKLTEIDISEAVKIHLADIGHDLESQDTAYENAQARERTQVLLDLANMYGGIVIGTGDLSECMQGFATFNGDHISNYALNSTLTKTHLRFIVGEISENTENKDLGKVLKDIIDTPISPELKSEDKGTISQKTEDIIGPYGLIDFFIYHHLKYHRRPKEIFDLAKLAFGDDYEDEIIKKWLVSYFKRFSASQFKRATAVDGPNITGLSTSPRLGYKIASDMASGLYLDDLNE